MAQSIDQAPGLTAAYYAHNILHGLQEGLEPSLGWKRRQVSDTCIELSNAQFFDQFQIAPYAGGILVDRVLDEGKHRQTSTFYLNDEPIVSHTNEHYVGGCRVSQERFAREPSSDELNELMMQLRAIYGTLHEPEPAAPTRGERFRAFLGRLF